MDRVVPADAARWCCYSVSRCCWEGEGAAPPSLSEWRHREWKRRSIQCNPVSLPGSLTQSSAMATAESLLSGTSSVWKLGFSFQSPPLDVDVKSPLTLGNIHTCGQAWEKGGKYRAQVLSLGALKGSDSTCLRRLGLSPGSIFAVLFCDPLDLEGGQELALCVWKSPSAATNCPIRPPVWVPLLRYTFLQLYGCVQTPQSLVFGRCIDF